LFQPYRRILGAKSKQLVGLQFTPVAMNYMYVPRCFAAEICNMFPNATIVVDNMPGATPTDQLKDGASRMPVGSSGLLISHVGVAKSWVHRSAYSAPEKAWRETRHGLRRKRVSRRWRVANVFAHIRLKAIYEARAV